MRFAVLGIAALLLLLLFGGGIYIVIQTMGF